MRTVPLLLLVTCLAPPAAFAQGLREVPRRFLHVEPVGLLLGVGSVGLEAAVARRTTVELGGIGVYSEEDGIRIAGAGGGLGIRQYFGQFEAAGLMLGARVDAVWLEADNTDSQIGFLGTALADTRSHVYLGLGGSFGFRWVSTGGFFLEPRVSYEYFIGPRPLVPGSRDLQDDLGFAIGVAFGVAW